MGNGNCCQCGLCCPKFPCEACQTVKFDVLHDGEIVALMEKKTKGCLANVMLDHDADNFSVTYPQYMTDVNHRALLMSSILFLDYMFFEDNNKRGGAGAL